VEQKKGSGPSTDAGRLAAKPGSAIFYETNPEVGRGFEKLDEFRAVNDAGKTHGHRSRILTF